MWGSPVSVVKAAVIQHLREAEIHCQRLQEGLMVLQKHYGFPLSKQAFDTLQQHSDHLARADQVAYRFSKAQDCIGAKLFASFMEWMQEDTNKPFRDILNRLEKLGFISVEEWNYVREIRNEIAHDYTFNAETERVLVNAIHQHCGILHTTLRTLSSALERGE
jgi:hypothetical protein